ncbi:hypothetical protein [Burkholderia gladioli]|uniref:hypothetical protein n=1 Tax=Burkholderia gladioli TaxID=28095 RepID=UPI00202FCC83|nr:hypothetical protein [Burkholderia gladioli]URV24130.1 hypothetical protein NAL90_14715 [Burkholderia gladioli]
MQGQKQRAPIDELVFIDDFFRVSENGLPCSPENRKFLRAFFGTGASRLGWRVREFSAQSQKGSICIPKLMESLGLPQDSAGWAAACTANLQPAAEQLAVLALTPASLVIGWGLPPSIMQYVESCGAAFLDVEIDSIRFTRNLHLAVRTNDPGIQAELERLRVDDEVFWASAASLRGHFARRGNSSIAHSHLSVGLFVGQTSVDLALVGGGRLAQPADFLETIQQWAQQVDLLAIRPHPAQPAPDQFRVLLDSIPNALLVSHNTYSLLCADNLAFVGAMSSGVLKEAPYFGCHDVRRLLADDRNTAKLLPRDCSPWITVKLEVASARSLKAFSVARSHANTQLAAEQPSTFDEDTLNQIFAYRWGLDPAAVGLPEFPSLSPGQSLSMAAGTPAAQSTLFTHGWHWPESWGTWTAEEHAGLVVLLDCPTVDGPDDGFVLSLHGDVYAPHSAQAPEVRIVVSGQECRALVNQDDKREWVVDLNADAVRRRILTITIKIQGALRPCDVSQNTHDQRRIGFGLRGLSLSERKVRIHELVDDFALDISSPQNADLCPPDSNSASDQVPPNATTPASHNAD